TKLHVGGNNPNCGGYAIEEGGCSVNGYDGPIMELEKGGAEMNVKMGRVGKYMD
ncbi:hypothetical protein, partial [Salmonella enterica]|uniref:hypothetical protein n=1 Tax=Salmonella enterica TaxID=28901 RepID=UPI000A570CB1